MAMFLENLLGSTCKISVLRTLLFNPEKNFTINELAREAGCSPSTIYAQLAEIKEVTIYDPVTKTLEADMSNPYLIVLKKLFEVEKKVVETQNIFNVLSKSGQYYLTGESAIVARGLSRDFTVELNLLHLMADRKIVKIRGPLSVYSPIKIVIEEGKILPEDYDEIEISFQGWSGRIPVATVERAVIDALRRIDLIEKLDDVVEALLSPMMEIDEVLRMAKKRNVPKRTLAILQAILVTSGTIKEEKRINLPRKTWKLIEEAVQHVLAG